MNETATQPTETETLVRDYLAHPPATSRGKAVAESEIWLSLSEADRKAIMIK